MKAVPAFHPPLFALHPLLALYAANVSLIPWQDVVAPIGIAIAIAMALWGIVALALRDWGRGAAAASLVVYGVFSYQALSEGWASVFLPGAARPLRAEAPIWLWAVVTIGLATAVAWKHKGNRLVTMFLNITGLAMCLLAVGSITGTHAAIRKELARASAQRIVQPGSSTQKLGSPPDIFYIVLDGYGRTDTFERLYGFSDKAFVEALKARGFYVAPHATSNYSQTELSLASSLNMAPVQELAEQGRDAGAVRGFLDSIIAESAVSSSLKQKGYRYIAITTGFPALGFHPADVWVQHDSGSTLYLNALMDKTPFRRSEAAVRSIFDRHRTFIRGGFSALEKLATPGTAPRFVVVHIVSPHPPFVFRANGEPSARRGPFGFWDGSHYNEVAGTDADYREGYRGQAQYIAKLTLQAVDALLKPRGANPVILIQGDHGPKSNLDQGSLARTDVREVFSILSAYRVPPSLKGELYESITPVNSFRVLLSHLFGESHALKPDRSYFSTWEKPLDFVDVTHEVRNEAGGTPGAKTIHKKP